MEPIREFQSYLIDTLKQNPHVKCRELLIGGAEHIAGKIGNDWKIILRLFFL